MFDLSVCESVLSVDVMEVLDEDVFIVLGLSRNVIAVSMCSTCRDISSRARLLVDEVYCVRNFVVVMRSVCLCLFVFFFM